MLLEFGARNFYSFKEGFELSLRFNNNCPENISNGNEYTNVICVKGANASGKTNVLKTINFLRGFVLNSFSYKPEEEIPLEPFFYSKDPSDFYVTFRSNNIEYRYELSTTKEKVISETIYRKDKRYTKIIDRKEDSFEYVTKEFIRLRSMKLRSNASIISTAHQYDIEAINIFHDFFLNIVTNVSRFGYHGFNPDVSSITKVYNENENLFSFVKEQIRQCDTGIIDIKIFDREDENGEKIYFPMFYHDLEDSIEAITISSESSGTKALYQVLFLYKMTLELGGVLVLDEFDINLHPHILPKLISLFDCEVNINNAQLIFTTHNSKIMDELGKYRLVLVNKEKNSSYAYRLDELPGDIIRNDRLLSKVYNTGKIGGTPKL